MDCVSIAAVWSITSNKSCIRKGFFFLDDIFIFTATS